MTKDVMISGKKVKIVVRDWGSVDDDIKEFGKATGFGRIIAGARAPGSGKTTWVFVHHNDYIDDDHYNAIIEYLKENKYYDIK